MSSAHKISKASPSSTKRPGLKAKFADPNFILEQMASYIKEGDVASITDLLAAYISNSPKYPNQEHFAQIIGTTRQTLHRMLSHSQGVSLKVFFSAIEQIADDAENEKL